MKKHEYNIYPEAKPEDYREIVESIRANGYLKGFPIITYQGEILDGWHRWKACQELGITPIIKAFAGSDMDAINYVIITNTRRDLNSGQKACIAIEAAEIIRAVVEDDRRSRQGATQAAIRRGETPKSEACNPMQQILSKGNRNVTDTILAKAQGTNRTYVSQAAKVQTDPELFAKVKAGKMTLQDANKAVRAIPVDPWLDDEKERKATVLAGQSVVANQQRDKNLIQWAESKGLVCRVDRGTPYGNPFILGQDGDRDTVCDSYANHYLPHKPSIKPIKGKVLVCHCYPLRCHAESLI